MNVFICMEGFQLGRLFVPKEVTVLSEGEEWRHFLLLPPTTTLSENDNRTIRYTTRNVHEITWTDGDIPHYSIHSILRKFQDSTIYTYGYSTTNYLRSVLPTTVIVDVQKEGYEMADVLPKKGCFLIHDPRHYSLAKAHAVRDYTFTGIKVEQ